MEHHPADILISPSSLTPANTIHMIFSIHYVDNRISLKMYWDKCQLLVNTNDFIKKSVNKQLIYMYFNEEGSFKLFILTNNFHKNIKISTVYFT